jgi:hypothetical protein
VIGNEIDHLIQRDQLDAFAGAGADMTARAAAFGGRPGQCRQLRPVGAQPAQGLQMFGFRHG